MKSKKKRKITITACESCLYYDYNDEDDLYECMMNLDEDEYLRFMTARTNSCPYYKFYDEYKSVQKQN